MDELDETLAVLMGLLVAYACMAGFIILLIIRRVG